MHGLRGFQHLSDESVIQLANVSKTYGDVDAVHDVSLSIKKGSVSAFLGPNGAGKSTLLNMIMGSIAPSSGSLSVFGSKPGAAQVRVRAGVMLQISGVPQTLTVREHINLFRTYYLNPIEFDEIIQRSGLTGLENRRYGRLSGGQQQRLHFALAICGDPDLLFLDEPTSSLDVESRLTLWGEIQRLSREERTVVITTHNLEEAERLADRIVLVDGGKIVTDASPAELRSLVGSTQVSAQTSLNIEHLERLPGVMRVELTTNRAHLFVTSPMDAVRAWLDSDSDLKDLEVRPAQLQDAYLHLVHTAEKQ